MRTLLFFIIVICSAEIFAQYNGKSFSISINGVYTTTARIYKDPYASDPVLRMDAFPVEDILNPAVEIRYALTERIMLAVGTEYMSAVSNGSPLNVFYQGAVRTVYVEDGFSLIPLEISAYYLLPFSTEKFKFLIGGGGAYYFGSHKRKFGSAEVSTVERKFAYGIHVNVTMDYMLREFISVRGEMKFRDPQFTVKSAYNSRDIVYEGNNLRLLQETFDSKINIDGVTFILGFALHF